MSLRISSSRDDAGEVRRGGYDQLQSAAADGGDSYMSRLVKLIPGEAVAVFPFLDARADQLSRSIAEHYMAQNVSIDPPMWPKYMVAWLVLSLAVMLRAHATRGADGMPQWGAVAIAAVSFVLWVPVMDGELGLFDALGRWIEVLRFDPTALDAEMSLPQQARGFIVETLLVLWTILVPLFYQPRK